ncbi:MAG: hypothetical protein P1V97_04880 [Planctomycetota bacterium]|nr:hypothetical protein [Planctomycetota bacterium]
MSWIQRWLRATFQYNPSFPISALLLLIGLVCLSENGSFVSGDWLGPGVNLGILQGYEGILLATLLFLLWPRKIVYESTSILIIFAIIRYAAPFIIIGMAGNQNLPMMLLFGLVLSVSMIVKTYLLLTRVGLAHHRWEHVFDSGAYILCALIFPLIAEALASLTGFAFSVQTARVIQWICWWSLAAFLFVLCQGLPDLGCSKPLKSRRGSALWRCLTIIALPFLLGNALWVGGELPVLMFVLPLPLAMVSVVRYCRKAYGHTGNYHEYSLPALLSALVLITPKVVLLGGLSAVSRHEAFALFVPIAARTIPIIAPNDKRKAFVLLCSVAVVAPIVLMPGVVFKEIYMLALSCCLLSWGLWVRNDRLVVTTSLLSSFMTFHLLSPPAGAPFIMIAFMLCSVLCLLCAWRKTGPLSFALAINGSGVAFINAFFQSPVGADLFCVSVVAALSLSFLLWRYESRRVFVATAFLPTLLVAGHIQSTAVNVNINYGYLFIFLAFAAVPVGIGVALKREAEEENEVEDLDLEFDPFN